MANPLHDTLFAPHENRDDPFIEAGEGNALDYAAFIDLGAQLANTLVAAGLKAGDRLAVQVEKSPEALALYAACVRAGLVFLPLNPAYTTEELAYFLQDSEASVVVCDPSREKEVRPLAEAQGAVLHTLGPAGTGSLLKDAAQRPTRFDTVERSLTDLAALLYTSGTTGRSKGAMLSQENLLSNALSLAELWGFTSRDVLLHALPIFHTHGLFVATNVVLAAGASMMFMPRFEMDAVIGALPRSTTMMGVPTFYVRLLDDPRLTRDLTGHMRLFISGSAPLLAETHEAFAERTGHEILERYGMTETGMNSSNPLTGERRPGTVGPPLPGVEIRVTDPSTGRSLPSGEVGRIEVRGPNVFSGYWQMPEKTAAELRDNGFFITGDLGSFDTDGYLRIVGREKDLIISGGYNVYPKEIELLIDAQPGVAESAVIGVPHRDFGETPVAVVVPTTGIRPERESLEGELRAGLARYKHPRALVFVDELPRNAMGKVQKNLLRERYRNMFSGN